MVGSIDWSVSSTYREILRRGDLLARDQADQERYLESYRQGYMEGRFEVARRVCVNLGERKLGPPSAATLARITTMPELHEIESLIFRILNVNSWDELLSDSSPSRGDGA